MRAGDLLRQLDRRLLPPLARAVSRLGDGRVRFRVVTSTALLSCLAVLVTAVWAADRPPAVDQTVGDVARVGVVEGQSIPGYLAASRGELAALAAATPAGAAEGTWALVAFTAYLPPDRVAAVVDGVAVSEVFSRVPLPDTQTQIVRIEAFAIPADVVAGMARVAERKDDEARDYRARAAALTGDAEDDRQLRRLYDSGAVVASAEAAAYRSACSCVYAAVVRAGPDGLRRLADRPGVRAVDPAPEVRRLDRAVFTPPLPDQQDVVRPPADDDLPSSPAPGSTGVPTPSAPPPSGVPGPVAPPSAAPTQVSTPSGGGEVGSGPPAPTGAAPSVGASDAGSPSQLAPTAVQDSPEAGPAVVP